MKGDILRGNPVYLGLRLGDPGKNSQGPLLRAGAYAGIRYQSFDILPGMVAVFAGVLMMTMCVGVFMGVVMVTMCVGMMVPALVMPVIVIARFLMAGLRVIPGTMIVPAFQFYQGVDTGNAAPVFPDECQFPSRKAELGEFGPQQIGVNPQAYQRAQGHIPGYARKTIKV
jgi:hypothetical protein